MTYAEPIASYGLLADCNSVALVTTNGSIDSLCFPRYECPSEFAGCSPRRLDIGRSTPRVRRLSTGITKAEVPSRYPKGRQRILAVNRFPTDIAEWGWPEAPEKLLLDASAGPHSDASMSFQTLPSSPVGVKFPVIA
jgi:hypothetical protein